jgi:transposase
VGCPAAPVNGVAGHHKVGLSGYKLKTGLDHYLPTCAENGSHYTARSELPEVKLLLDRLRPEDIAEAVLAYEHGESARQVAQGLGVSKTGFLGLLRKLGLEPRARRGLSKAQVDEAAALYESGLLLREIGRMFDVSRDCVRLALKAAGVTMRPGLGVRQVREQ